MSSLYRALRKRGPTRVQDLNRPEDEDLYLKMITVLCHTAEPPNIVLVNVNAVAKDFVNTNSEKSALNPGVILGQDFTALHPPFRSMWFEWSEFGFTWAAQLVCGDTKDVPLQVRVVGWLGGEGECIGPIWSSAFFLREDGTPFCLKEDGSEYPKDYWSYTIWGKGHPEWMFGYGIGVCFHSLMRLNCCNVELRAIGEPKTRSAKRRDVPACVWREIVVTSNPKIRTTGKGCIGNGERDEEKRAFWIRGHYADYRNGPGLFGNSALRKRFWIPEFERGNEDLGVTIPEYSIK